MALLYCTCTLILIIIKQKKRRRSLAYYIDEEEYGHTMWLETWTVRRILGTLRTVYYPHSATGFGVGLVVFIGVGGSVGLSP